MTRCPYGIILFTQENNWAFYFLTVTNARLRENSYAGGHSVIEGQAHLFGNARAIDHAHIGERSKLSGNVLAAGHSVIKGKSLLFCNVYVGGTAVIENETLSGDMYRTRTRTS